MQIRGNLASLLAWRAFSTANHRIERSIGRLASGKRINSAADDASGLAISHQLLGQFKRLTQASRNASDGIALLNTAESGMKEIATMLHRARELAVQAANGTVTAADREKLQGEVFQLLQEIDRIADTASYNGHRLLNTDGNSAAVGTTLRGLQSGWLEQSENLVDQFFGLSGNGKPLNIAFSTSGSDAWMEGTPGPGGIWQNVTLNINLDDFGSASGADGGSGPIYNDRKVARAMAMATLAMNANYNPLPNWFKSGMADLIAGGDENLAQEINSAGVAGVINAIDSPWSNSSLDQASAYLAAKYLNEMLSGMGMQISDVMAELANGNDLDTALLFTIGLDVPSFITDFKSAPGGQAFLTTYQASGGLTDADVGGLSGGDASSVVPNTGTFSTNPTANMNITWPGSGSTDPAEFVLQVGADQGETMKVTVAHISTFGLGLNGIDLISDPQKAIGLFTSAIDQVAQARTQVGAQSNRLGHVVGANELIAENQLNGYSRIMDLDMARELTDMTRHQIILSSSAAMLAQANTVRQHVLWLINGLSRPAMGI